MKTLRKGILRTEAVELIAGVREGAISIVTMQPVAAWRAIGQNDNRNINLVGSMGSASALGLGLALALPQERVFVLDGDGSLVMQLGTLISVGTFGLDNFVHFIFNNGIYQTSGEQPVPGSQVADLAQIALASGYKTAVNIESLEGATEVLRETLSLSGPILINISISGQGTITNDGIYPPSKPLADQILLLRKSLNK